MNRIPRRLRLLLYGLGYHAALFALVCAAWVFVKG